jgi:hypothetical protein
MTCDGTPDDPAPDGCPDPYLLRDLIWCELCHAPMLPVLLSGTGRHYGCPYRECPRQLVDAAAVEQLVWDLFAALYEGSAVVVPTYLRREALRHKLKRVRVGEDLTELWHEWADP